ncbi:MAG: hypothetical protein FJ390_01965 [Verrucomicrobia bacterium]|nr:hypothetical protein [Verrucomicrobiota bacterium]
MSFHLIFLKKSLSFFLGALLLVAPLRGEFNNPINKTILEAISSMPHGGGYSTSNLAMKRLQHAVTVSDGKLVVRPTLAQPSFCSEATYLLFLKTLLLLQEQHQLTLDTATLSTLLPRGQPDGEGIWGRWNANGPGVACLFHDLKIGKNFTSLEQAEPGDFLKIFWTSSVGAIEHGHLVVYLGHEMRNGVEMIHFWSSNQHVGYGDKWVPLRAMRHLLFSRLTNPAVLTSWHQLPRSDIYLASLLSKTSSWEEVKQRCEIVEDRR